MRPYDDRPSPAPDGCDTNQAELDEALSEIGFNITTGEVAERLGISLEAACVLVRNALESIRGER